MMPGVRVLQHLAPHAHCQLTLRELWPATNTVPTSMLHPCGSAHTRCSMRVHDQRVNQQWKSGQLASASPGSPLVPEDLALVAAPAAAKTVIISDCSRRASHVPRSSHSDPDLTV